MKRPLNKNPEAWTRFRKALCPSCRASCCQGWPVEASVADLCRLGLMTEAEAASSLFVAARRLRRAGLIRRFRSKRLVFELERKRNDDCVFLGADRRCTVYELRPEICRRFPRMGPRPGFCPYREKA